MSFSFGGVPMKALIPILAILAAATAACRHPKPAGQSSTADFRSPRLASAAGEPAALAVEPMLITDAGVHTWLGRKWRVEVRGDDGSLHISRLRPTVSSTIGVGGWTAQPGWFAFVESESRVWAFDGGRHLSLTTHKSNTQVSDALISYGPNRFPCEVPHEVASRLPEAFRQTIITNE